MYLKSVTLWNVPWRGRLSARSLLSLWKILVPPRLLSSPKTLELTIQCITLRGQTFPFNYALPQKGVRGSQPVPWITLAFDNVVLDNSRNRIYVSLHSKAELNILRDFVQEKNISYVTFDLNSYYNVNHDSSVTCTAFGCRIAITSKTKTINFAWFQPLVDSGVKIFIS